MSNLHISDSVISNIIGVSMILSAIFGSILLIVENVKTKNKCKAYISKYNNKEAKEKVANVLSEKRIANIISTLFLLLFMLTGICFCGLSCEQHKYVEELTSKSQSYVIYVDGRIVDIDKIDITKYRKNHIKIDDNKHEIYITTS